MKSKQKIIGIIGRGALHAPVDTANTGGYNPPLHRTLLLLLSLLLLTMQPLAVLACATCGCSELCPLAMVQDTDTDSKDGTSLSNSLWGSIILKMAYQRDAQIQKLAKHIKGVNALTSGAIYTTVAGTLSQNILSEALLNPDQGNDSYLPGGLGLGLSGILNIALDGSMLINWRIKKKIKARQLVINEKVETLLNHLEYSDAYCPDAQRDLAEIIGTQGAADCLKLWRLSHSQIASGGGQNTSMLDKPNIQSNKQLSQVEMKSIAVKVVSSQNID